MPIARSHAERANASDYGLTETAFPWTPRQASTGMPFKQVVPAVTP